ncbi:hypothetical protein HC174_15360 [Salinimicrobium sp. CDJ15-81-2]|nr:hypothetical protein [Salinimicrobium nanhaiense]
MKRIKIIYLILLTALNVGCQRGSDSKDFYSENSDSLKLDLLKKALLDQKEPPTLPFHNVLISDFYKIPNFDNQIPINDEWKEVSRIEYLSYHLNEKDTLFLRRQMNDKTNHLARLSDEGFRIFPTKKHLKDGISLDSIDKIIEQKSGQADYIMVGKPIFSKDLNKLYLQIAGPNYGDGYIFTKVKDSIKRFNIENWME